MIGSLIAGYIGGSLASSGKRNTTNTVVHRHAAAKKNELIEYHKWLEEREAMEKERAEEYNRTHCRACGKKISMRIDSIPQWHGYDVCLSLSCDCGTYRAKHGMSIYEYDLENGSKKISELYHKAFADLKEHERKVLCGCH